MARTAPSTPVAGLVFALALSGGLAAAQDDPAAQWRPPDLIDPVASFGAVTHDGALNVYGGHVGRTHVHSMENISPGFRRLALEPGRTWEELARGPLLQGAALVSDGSAIYRVGGMTAVNATAAEPEVLRSSRSAARYSIAEDLVIVGGMAVQANLALRRGRAGARDRTDVAWTAGSGSNFASPFVYRDCVYWVNPAGAARCLAPESGAVRWTHRLPASIWATPLGHGNYVYFVTIEGVTQVLRASADAPEVVTTNHLSVDAPVTGFAAVDDAIVIRAGTEVIRVGRTVE